MYGQKFGLKLVRPLRIEKNKNGRKKSQSSTTLGDRGIYLIDPDDEEYKEILKNTKRKLERPMAPAMPCERAPNSITKVFPKSEIASEKTNITVYGCKVESHETN